MYRVGVGYDIHPFAPLSEGRPLVLGGVTIPGGRGLQGHSDADVLVHALCSALLGAAGLGDLGLHFPDTDPRYRGISSLELLRDSLAMAVERGFEVVNVDAVVVAEEPKIAPHVEAMKGLLAAALGASPEEINIKGTRPEGLGALGRREGVACHAVALLRRRKGARPPRAPLRRPGRGQGRP